MNKILVKYINFPLQYKKIKTELLKAIENVFESGNFILGSEVEKFEKNFAKYCETKYALGVGNGTSALFLTMKALGIGNGDEVITASNSFLATAGAIAATGAKPVFVDAGDDYNINPNLIKDAITKKTKAILPVHLYGCPAKMQEIIKIASQYNLLVIEDACQAINSAINKKKVGSFGITGCFSLHPLKGINVWGDGGIITTNSQIVRDELYMLRNNGLKNRNECARYSYNCRLDTLQAIVALHVIKDIDWITNKRIENAKFYDKELSKFSQITIPERAKDVKQVYHTYVVKAKNRDELYNFLLKNKIEAKIHYPIPLHLQEASKYLNYKKGDFPKTEEQVKSIITLPAHQHLKKRQLEYVVKKIKEFYK